MTSKELHRIAQDLGVPKAQIAQHASAVQFDREFVHLVFKEVASDTNERTLIFGLLPKNCGGGNTIHTVFQRPTFAVHPEA